MQKPLLVTGPTGYVGARLVGRLLENGRRVRAVGRSLAKIKARAWAGDSNLEAVEADLLDPKSLGPAMAGCDTAYYLVHSLNASAKDFVKLDLEAARNMAKAAEVAGLSRIIYLGDLGYDPAKGDRYLRSRMEVGRILQSGSVAVTYLRTAMILGAGSTYFEMLRYLTDRLPVSITSRRVLNPLQPIAITNVIDYLVRCLEHEETRGRTFDLGGPDTLTYRDLMQLYAREAGLKKRVVIPCSLMTPSLAAYMVHFVTPIPSYIAKPISYSLGAAMVAQDGHRIRSIIPQELIPCGQAIHSALQRIEQKVVKSSWMDAGAHKPPEWIRYHDAAYAGGTVKETWYRMVLAGDPEAIWEPIRRIGGKRGWYFANWMWKLRGFTDRLIGGHGIRRGRRNPDEIKTGDALDFWRVMDSDPGRRLLLLAEMKAPGEATMEFRIKRIGEGKTELIQIASFLPRGLAGLLYWYSIDPFHFILFRGMMKGIARAAGAEILSGPERVPLPAHRKGKA